MVANLAYVGQIGDVAVVTLAAEPWLEHCARALRPALELRATLRELDVEVY